MANDDCKTCGSGDSVISAYTGKLVCGHCNNPLDDDEGEAVTRQVGLDGSEYTTFGEDESTFPIEVREELAAARRRLLEDD